MSEPSVDSPKGDWDPGLAEQHVEAALAQGRDLCEAKDYAGAVETMLEALRGLDRPQGIDQEQRYWSPYSVLSANLHREIGLVHLELAPIARDVELDEIPADLLEGYPDDLTQRITRAFRDYRNEQYLNHLDQYVRHLGECSGKLGAAWTSLGNAELPDERQHENDFSNLPLERRDEICRERMPLVVATIEADLVAAAAARYRLTEMEAAVGRANRYDWNTSSHQPRGFARSALREIDRHLNWVTSSTGFDPTATDEELDQFDVLRARAQLAVAEGCVVQSERSFPPEQSWEEAAVALADLDESRLSDEERERLSALRENRNLLGYLETDAVDAVA